MAIKHCNIIELAFVLSDAVSRFAERVRWFFYTVMLSGHECPKCSGRLEMMQEGRARCSSCGHLFDPTVIFQRCAACGGKPKLVVRRYQCSECGSNIQSRFLFDGLVFNVDYFRQKMVESRQRKAEQRERVRQMLAESRSSHIPLPIAELDSVPGLVDVLNALTQGSDSHAFIQSTAEFNLKRYQAHIQAHLQPVPITLCEIPPLSENARKDKIWRFIALIFLAHDGVVDIWQEGLNIMVRKNEIDPEGQGVPGDLEANDGYERSVCRAEA